MFMAAQGQGAALERTCRPRHEREGPTIVGGPGPLKCSACQGDTFAIIKIRYEKIEHIIGNRNVDGGDVRDNVRNGVGAGDCGRL